MEVYLYANYVELIVERRSISKVQNVYGRKFGDMEVKKQNEVDRSSAKIEFSATP
uniref:Uncharacterized protein n=1 Tax=Cajanus cajan TaxID=3821 RepID=A0A151SG94_CAJCA|nr:hypothetical protein KK1_000013 [Cajanus cajan]